MAWGAGGPEGTPHTSAPADAAMTETTAPMAWGVGGPGGTSHTFAPEAAAMTEAAEPMADLDATQVGSGYADGQMLGAGSPRATRNARKRLRRRERATKAMLTGLARRVACEVAVEVGMQSSPGSVSTMDGIALEIITALATKPRLKGPCIMNIMCHASFGEGNAYDNPIDRDSEEYYVRDSLIRSVDMAPWRSRRPLRPSRRRGGGCEAGEECLHCDEYDGEELDDDPMFRWVDSGWVTLEAVAAATKMVFTGSTVGDAIAAITPDVAAITRKVRGLTTWS